MRNRLMISTAALLLASAGFAGAQQPAPEPATGSIGVVDFGYRGTTTDGDAARFQRYRDLEDGASTQILLEKNTDRYLFAAKAFNVGYSDQVYLGSFTNGRLDVDVNWASNPINYGFNTVTPWTESAPGVFSLDAATRLAVQNKVPGVVGIPSNAAALSTASIYRSLARPFDISTQRDAANFNAKYATGGGVGFDVAFNTSKKSGYQPWNGGFAFNNANELPLPLDNRTNDFTAGLEYASRKGMARVAWTGSWFDNQIESLVWDNPIRATDFNSGNAALPYDASGYSNGNGPATGRMALSPSNTMNAVSTMAMYKLARTTTVNGSFAFTSFGQDAALIPWTSNSVIMTPAVLAAFPHLAHLPRETAEGSVHGYNAVVNLNSNPNKYVGFTARYRFNDRKNLTPAFDAVEYVRFDAVPEETGSETEPYNIRTNKFDADVTFNVLKYTALRAGYTRLDTERTNRVFDTMADNVLRVSADTVGNQYVMVRGLYEITSRRGGEPDMEFLEHSGSQLATRFYDEAELDRKRGTVLFVVTPVEVFDVTVTLAAGNDDYVNSATAMGLVDNTNQSYNVGLNFSPTGTVNFGANFGLDKFSALQRSRNANPLPDLQFVDPTRDWTLDNDETVNNVDVYLNLFRAIRNVDVRTSYSYSDSDNGFSYGGPRIEAMQAANQFLALPNVTNKWQRVALDVQYYFAKNVGVAAGYWFEKFDVNDFATVDLPGQPGVPRIDYLGSLYTGYGNRGYEGNTMFLRMLYRF